MKTRRSDIRSKKVEFIRSGHPPRVLEVCSGCGGMSLGFSEAGFELLAHVELDQTAAETYALNFSAPSRVRSTFWQSPLNMVEMGATELVSGLGLIERTEEAFDILAAGLPCQAFARIGRSKLRSITGKEDAFQNDARAKLYLRFLEYVDTVEPIAVIIENVPDILNFGGHNVPEEICDALEARGYLTSYTLLNAAYYGVPQMRERLFLIALDRSLGIRPTFPDPSHHVELPSGYEGTRNVALKHVPVDGSRFRPIPISARTLPPAITVRTALSDLPYISEHRRNPTHMRRRKVSDSLPYRTSSGLTSYQRQMREWPGFSTVNDVSGNVVRLTPRDFPIFEKMPWGADYPQALRVAEAIFADRLDEESIRPDRGSARWTKIRNQCVPPYDPGKFPNKWWKLDPTFPSRTLTAHMGKDTYSHIHWDGRQQRTISVREAARLQSFPDGFRFAGEMNASFRQIGNAVPPLLALAVANQLMQDLIRSRSCELAA